MHYAPSFANPPVVETALSIQFAELLAFRTTHFGLFHRTILDRFPISEDRPRLPPVHEEFPLRPRLQVHFESAAARPGRVWFRDAPNGCVMLQLQPDRFAFNWCRQEGELYPRFHTNLPRLIEHFDGFRDFARAQNLGEVKPDLCEVTYVNDIHPRPGEDAIDCFAAVLSGVRWDYSDGSLTRRPESVSFNRAFRIGDERGRLYAEAVIANVDQASTPDPVAFVRLKLTARVVHNAGDDLTTNLELAHEWVVNSFVSLTTEQARRERWEQES